MKSNLAEKIGPRAAMTRLQKQIARRRITRKAPPAPPFLAGSKRHTSPGLLTAPRTNVLCMPVASTVTTPIVRKPAPAPKNIARAAGMSTAANRAPTAKKRGIFGLIASLFRRKPSR